MAHHYVKGDPVWCQEEGRVAELDQVIAVTARAVITDAHGTFLHAHIDDRGEGRRRLHGYPAVRLWPPTVPS